MESDLSLIEISGEDDSLLQQIPSDDMSNNNFLCSPLQIPRSKRSADSSHISRLEGMKGNEHAEKPSFSSLRDNSNKENTSAIKSEVLKFGEQPQQMKRRKKGGGYNLRKSLAWNRAFFTEEGVLDPLELSMISGTFNKSSGDMLSVIHEEGRNSLLGDSDCTSDSADLQTLEENIFKELPASTLIKGKKIGGGLLPKHDSSAQDKIAPASVTTRKVLSAHDVNRSGSKRGGCPRPLASSSHKRPANANTTKAAMKESKLPKILVSKPDPCLLPTSAKSATPGANCSSRNQIAQRVNGKKIFGLNGSSNNTRSAQNNAKSGPDYKSLSSKTSVQPSRRNMANSPTEIPSSRNLRPPLVTKSNSGFKVIPDPVLPATGTQASNGCDKSSKVAVSLPQNAQYIGENMQCAQLQATKPSGLRMPSPSLGFFGQSKASTSQSLMQKSTQPCNIPESSTPSLQKHGATNPVGKLRPPRAPGKMLKVVNDVTTTRNIRGLSSSRECSVPSTVNSVPHESMKLNWEVNNLQNVEVKVAYEPKCSEPIYNQQQLHSILDDDDELVQEDEEPYKIEKISCKGDTESQNDNKLLLHNGSREQLKKDNDHMMVADVCAKSRDSSGEELENPHLTSEVSLVVQVKGFSQTNDMIEHQQVEDKQYNLSVEDHDVISESQSGDAISYSNQGMHHDWLRSTHDVDEQFGEQAELMKPCFHEADRVSHGENQRLLTNDGILFQESRSSEESLKYDIADVSLKVRGLSGSELESSHGPSQLKYIEQANKLAVGEDIMTIKSHVIDAQVQSSGCNSLLESRNSNMGTSAVHNKCLLVDGVNEHSEEQSELQNPSRVERVSQDHHGLCLNDSCGSKLENPHFMSQLSPAVQVEGVSGTNDLIEQQHVEDNQHNLAVKNHGVISESQSGDAIGFNQGTLIVHNNWGSSIHDVNEQSGEQSEMIKPCTSEADRISLEENRRLQANDGILIEESGSFEEFQTYDTGNIADVSPKVRGSSGSDLESCHGSSQLEYSDLANEGAAGVYNMTEKSRAGDAQVQSLDDNLLVEGCNSNLTTSAVHNKFLMVVDDVNKKSGERLELQNPCCSSEDLESFEFVVSEQSDARGSESKSSGVLTWILPAMQDGGVVDVDKMAERPHVEDALSSAVEIESLVENQAFFIDTKLRPDIEFSGQATLECDSFFKMSKDQTIGAVTTGNFKAFFSLSEESGLSVQSVQTLSSGSTLQGMGVNGLKSNILPGEAESKSLVNDPHEENQRLQRKNGILFEESRSFEESQKDDSENIADISLKVRGSSGSELESSHGPSQPKYGDQAKECAAGVYNMTEKLHAGDAQVQSLDGNLLVEGCNSNLTTLSVHNKFLMDIDDVNKQSGERLELRNPCCSSEDSHVLESVQFVVSKQSDACGSELKSPGVLTWVPPAMQDGGVVDVDKMSGCQHVEDAPSSAVEIEPLVENQTYSIDTKLRHDIELSGQATLECDSFLKMSKDQTIGAVTTGNFKAFCSLGEESGLSVQSVQTLSNGSTLQGMGVKGLKSNILPGEAESKSSANDTHKENENQSILQGVGINELKSKTLPEEVETKISQNSNSPKGEVQHELDNAMSPSEYKDATMLIKKSGNGVQEDILVIKPPPNAVPFSDEWLAAIEAAGEDILTLKTGAVQNSPPDKSTPEPGPWSPVRRKNNEVGPFDCTKFTNSH